jgi:hypothetical protein
MNGYSRSQQIADKLLEGKRFGFFGKSIDCYFEDGQRVSYNDLWKALRKIHNLEPGHQFKIQDLCPDTYMGTFKYNYFWHRWPKRQP